MAVSGARSPNAVHKMRTRARTGCSGTSGALAADFALAVLPDVSPGGGSPTILGFSPFQKKEADCLGVVDCSFSGKAGPFSEVRRRNTTAYFPYRKCAPSFTITWKLSFCSVIEVYLIPENWRFTLHPGLRTIFTIFNK